MANGTCSANGTPSLWFFGASELVVAELKKNP